MNINSSYSVLSKPANKHTDLSKIRNPPSSPPHIYKKRVYYFSIINVFLIFHFVFFVGDEYIADEEIALNKSYTFFYKALNGACV